MFSHNSGSHERAGWHTHCEQNLQDGGPRNLTVKAKCTLLYLHESGYGSRALEPIGPSLCGNSQAPCKQKKKRQSYSSPFSRDVHGHGASHPTTNESKAIAVSSFMSVLCLPLHTECLRFSQKCVGSAARSDIVCRLQGCRHSVMHAEVWPSWILSSTRWPHTLLSYLILRGCFCTRSSTSEIGC